MLRHGPIQGDKERKSLSVSFLVISGLIYSDFGAGLDKNYCRNPDDTAMPWCYTDLECNRDYCDVCNVGTSPVDTSHILHL